MTPAANVKYRVKGTQLYVAPYKPRAAVSQAYEAASTSPRLANWNVSTGGPNTTISSSLTTMRSRSRDVARKNGLAYGGLETLVSNIIGTGIKPQFTTSSPELNKQLASLWLKWTDESDADGRFDFYGQQALAVRSMLEAGDVFARLRTRRPGDVRTVPLQIQLLESEFCPVEKTENLGGRIIENGIETNQWGVRTAYWMYRYHPNDQNLSRYFTGEPYPIPASEIVHLANVDRPGRIRGEPWLARALIKLYELDQYDDAQLVRQKLAAMFAGFMTPDANGKFSAQDTADSDGISLASLEPGTLQVLEPGASMTFTTPPSPGDSYEVFMRQQNRHIAGSMGILYEQFTGDFSQVNDRTWRAAMNGFLRRLERWQHSLVVYQFCRPIMLRWAEYAVLSGQIKLPAGIEVEDVARPKWQPQAHPYINPLQDVESRVKEIRAGLTSRSASISARGEDAEQTDAEIAADNKRADKLDLILDTNPKHTSNAGVTQARPAESDFAEDDEDNAEDKKQDHELKSSVIQIAKSWASAA